MQFSITENRSPEHLFPAHSAALSGLGDVCLDDFAIETVR
jgi:hypothetical protein